VLGRLNRFLDGFRVMPGNVGLIREELVALEHYLREELTAVRVENAALREDYAAVRTELARQLEILQLVYDDEPGNRRRLYDLRSSPEYELAFTETEPLVSIVVATYEHVDLLVTRSIPSALNQTYRNLEVVVVGETAPPETEAALEELGDERIRYHRLNRRGPYPDDPYSAWLVSGVPPFNAGVQLARGRWIAPLDDDDALRPRHVELLLEAARAERWEAALTLVEVHGKDAESTIMGAFPPYMGQFGSESVLYHAGLRFVECELGDALFGRPTDWSMCRRWLRMGVRMGAIDEVTADYHPSWAYASDRKREWAERVSTREGPGPGASGDG
jgi:hypothetical protein